MHNTNLFIEQICRLVQHKQHPQQALLLRFMQALLNHVELDDLKGRKEEDLYAALSALWQALNQLTDNPYVTVFNAQLETHGWYTEHSSVQIIVNDMPFLVDSVRMVLNRYNLTAHLFLQAPFTVQRTTTGAINKLNHNLIDDCEHLAIFHIEIDKQDNESLLNALAEELRAVLQQVNLVVQDWQPMHQQLALMKKVIDNMPDCVAKTDKQAAKRFIQWLADNNLTLLGYRYYHVSKTDNDYLWEPNSDGLGLMSLPPKIRDRRLHNLPISAQQKTLSHEPLMLTKTLAKSNVHRPVRMDYIGIKVFAEDGQLIGEHRFLGLYAAEFYNASVTQIPILQDTIRAVSKLNTVTPGTHAYKALINILETYPRDELLHSAPTDIARISKGVFLMQERGISRCFVRADEFGRFISVLVYVPRERYNTALRMKTQEILQTTFASQQEVEFTTYFSESVYARTHYIVHVPNNNQAYDLEQLSHIIIELSKSWDERLLLALKQHYGEAHGGQLWQRYAGAFSTAYMETHSANDALLDIEHLEKLCPDDCLEMLLYRPANQPCQQLRLRLYHWQEPIHLSQVLPTLENFGLHVIDETPFALHNNNVNMWIMDFRVQLKHCVGDWSALQRHFYQAYMAVWSGYLSDDRFNRLVFSAGLEARAVLVFKALAKYMQQLGHGFSQTYIASTLVAYPEICQTLFALWQARFDPQQHNDKYAKKLIDKLTTALDDVQSLDDDRIIRAYINLIMAAVRTNFYQVIDGNYKAYLSIKFLPANIERIPLPKPMFEIFVYSTEVEGVHLRGGKVARGGLRWSDRQEDYRTEVLGLVKAQQVKNGVIVPVGAKGGFICKRQPKQADRASVLAYAQQCYQTFIRGLLDVTDNQLNGEICPPSTTICHDDSDSYLVVAADKGTATFSDLANTVAAEYQFWLGDAFASGGSHGYDHKQMGITAKGAWESVKRHFREMGLDCQTETFTAVGIGDMAGDVFGNGLLLSPQTRLIAAFNHQFIFFDPDPDTQDSYLERQRLFADPSLTWGDYDRSRLSEGGGVFARTLKRIELTPPMQQWLDTKKSVLTPNELIHLVLQMPVDLIWNGGIGTYVKSQVEGHDMVGDRANDEVRINGCQLRAKIIGEGGNLGMTQLGRVEYALLGGRVNTDFIDNVGGVDCSDHEVNIKILLNESVHNGDLTEKQRNHLLVGMTSEVSQLVLDDCYQQTEGISVTAFAGVHELREQQRFIQSLQKKGLLDPALEFLPNDEQFGHRLANQQGLTRPELATLVSYAKMQLKSDLLACELEQHDELQQFLFAGFPTSLQQDFAPAISQHPLAKQIIATKLANHLVNRMGLSFVFRLVDEIGVNLTDIVACFYIADQVWSMDNLFAHVRQADNQLSSEQQLSILSQARQQLRRSVRWLLRHYDPMLSWRDNVSLYRQTLTTLQQQLPTLLDADELAFYHAQQQSLTQSGLSKESAQQMASLSYLWCAFDLTHLVAQTHLPITAIAPLYFAVGKQFSLFEFITQINQQAVTDHWQALARGAYREDTLAQHAQLVAVLASCYRESGAKDAASFLDTWMIEKQQMLTRWQHILDEFKQSDNHELTKFSVALRELQILINKIVS